MKNKKGLTILCIAAVMLMTGFTAQAQTSQEAQQKQQMEQEKQMKEMEMQLKKQQLEQEKKMVEMEKAFAERARDASRTQERALIYATPGSTGFADEGTYFISPFGQENQSQLSVRNSFDGNSDSAEGEFDVDESTRHIKCTINGKANSGKISIKVLYPGGKVFKDLSITSSAQISFTQSLTIKDEERGKYVGAWTYKVIADKAEGSYTLSFMTY